VGVLLSPTAASAAKVAARGSGSGSGGFVIPLIALGVVLALVAGLTALARASARSGEID
jgi:hypothetical protein